MILTVVLAAKDAPPRLLSCCLSSFARLEHAGDIEIIVVNSGTFPDVGYAFQDSFGAFRVLEMEPRGVYAAFNHGTAAANGRYLLFFGIDDIALPGMDSVIGKLGSDTDTYAMFAAAAYMQGYGISAPTSVRPTILFRNWCQQSLFYSKEYLSKNPFDTRYRIQADHKTNIEIRSNRNLPFASSTELVAYFATGGMSQTSYDLEFRRDLPAIAKSNFGFFFQIAVLLKQNIANIVKGRPAKRG